MCIRDSEERLAKESADLLKILLKDRTTKKSIVWATHSYESVSYTHLTLPTKLEV
ncbi:hypothetical protein PVA38_10960 [Streptococcus pneumoniae D39]|nr:hypothetical protein PVA38_10960 [Streptococcus pneumoniae D39]